MMMLVIYMAVYTMITLSVFFFQAEDGIRDVAVTGVQTCALPIFFLAQSVRKKSVCVQLIVAQILPNISMKIVCAGLDGRIHYRASGPPKLGAEVEIGRASCRERV